MFDEYAVAVPRTHAEQALLSRWTQKGRAERLYPGIYAAPGARAECLTRIRAAQAWYPDAVVTGRAAARLAYAPDMEVPTVDLVGTKRSRSPDGISLTRMALDPSWVMSKPPFRLTHPAFTAAYLAGEPDGADHVARALRAHVSVEAMQAAPLAGWPNNAARARVLRRFSLNPWSEAEARAQGHLTRAGIDGWLANRPIRIDGELYFGDIVFWHQRLLLEIDGFAFHSSRQAFESDRRRQNAFVLAGWRVLRFSWAMIEDECYFISMVRRALTM